MRKFWLVLLSVGLIIALAAPVLAADVKFSGSYIIQGYYEDNHRIAEIPSSTLSQSQRGPSDSFTWQRLRVGTVFQVAEGLSLTTGFDALEKVWGAPRSGTYAASYDSNGYQVYGSAEAENIKFRLAYVTFNTGIGRFLAGYQTQTVWGTSFGDSGDVAYGPRLRWDMTVGPSFFGVVWDKYEGQDNSYTSTGTATAETDASKDKYSAFYVYNWGKGSIGLLGLYALETRSSGTTTLTSPPVDNGLKKQVYLLDPYFKGQFGPVYVEAEFIWVGGKLRIWETTSTRTDVTYNGYSAYALAKVDFKPAYAGAAFVYISGDDAGTTDKIEAGIPGGAYFNPCLILGNNDLARWTGAIGNPNLAQVNTAVTVSAANPLGGVNGIGLENVWAYQVFVGVVPVPKLDVKASLTYAYLDKTPNTSSQILVYTGTNNGTDGNWISKNVGWEADIMATYKIYDNLSWMVGFGYLWAGDVFKGTNSSAEVKNDYLLTHKLTLTF